MSTPKRLACPDCKLELGEVTSGAVTARRCARCRGIWLDPGSFQRVCEEEARPSDEDTALVPSRGPAPPRTGPSTEQPVRYHACPECGEVMNRSNFGRVSGVVIDVCRPHGAWFDPGELGRIRRFLRDGGLGRYDRSRRLERERQAIAGPSGRARAGAPTDVYDVLVGGGEGWDVPSRIPRMLLVAVFGALGAWLLWRAFQPAPSTRSLGAGAVVGGLGCLYLAWRALREWAARRGR
jgi:Zn-finger nucleic acid-binding protein